MGKQISSKWKNAAVAVAFLFTLIVALCFMNLNAPIELATHFNPGKHTERQSISKDLIIVTLIIE